MRPKVTVFIPVFNQGELLEQSIESVLAQTMTDFELLILDHGTTNVTYRYVQPFLSGDPRISYHPIQDKNNLADARNYGVSNSNGEYIFWLGYDDYLNPDSLEVLSSGLDDEKDAAGIYANTKLIKENGEMIRIQKSGSFSTKEDAFWAMLSSPTVPIWTDTLMMRRGVLENFKYDLTMGILEDQEMIIRILKKHHLFCADEVVYNYRIHRNNYSRRARLESFGRWNLLYDKHVDNPGIRRYLKTGRFLVNLMKLGYQLISDNR